MTIVGGGFSLKKAESRLEKSRVSTGNISNHHVILGGIPIGIYMETKGILIIGTEEIKNKNGELCEPAKYIVKEGDYITAINDINVQSKAELIEAVDDLKAEEVVLSVRRNHTEMDVKFDCVEVDNDIYKLGIWVRDNAQGLGTLTYISTDSKFGALGHGIHDVDTGELLEISDGDLYKASIRGVQKGRAGAPGGLEGVIVYNSYNMLGTIEMNTENGVYGTVERMDKLLEKQEVVEVCKKEDVQCGPAVIRCQVDGKVEEYDIKIIRVDIYSRSENKSIVLQVKDKELLEKTGGIVQGMSGSPIIQNGKLVGAVTHVLVNDPTRGYGIFIENMLETANQVAEEQAKKDAS